MSGPLAFGTADGVPIELDLDRLIGSHACVIANAGAGKSGLLRRLIETTHGRIQQIVLDVEDEFYTLREKLDFVIAGGDGADAPAGVANAAALARAALEHNFNMVVQLNDLGPEGAPAFVGDFLESLIAAPRDLWRPLLVVLDEAHRFAPQEGSTAASHGVHALTAQGRKRGFTAILATQRLAKIDANVRGDVNNWLLGRVGQSLDRRKAADTLGFSPSSAEARGLQGLAPRTFWGFGPAIAPVPIQMIVADVETTPVRPGQAKLPTPPAPEALRAILTGLTAPAPPVADTIPADPAAAFERGADAGAALKKRDDRIRQLETELGDAKAELMVERAYRERAAGDFDAIATLAATAAETARILATPRATGKAKPAEAKDRSPSVPVTLGGGEAAVTTPAASPSGAAAAVGGLPPRRIKLLQKLQLARALFKTDAPHRPVIAWLAGTSPSSSTFEKDCGALRTAGLVTYPIVGTISPTPAGEAIAGPVPKKRSFGELREAICAQLPPRRDRLLRILFDRVELSRADLAEAAGVSADSSTFEKDLGAMRTIGLVTYPDKGVVALAEIYR